MSDLQKIRESILAKAHQDGQAYLNKEEQLFKHQHEEQRSALLQQRATQRQQLLDREAQNLSRQQQQIQNRQRQTALKQQNTLVDELFQGAIEQLSNASYDETMQFLRMILSQYGQSSMVVLLGDKTAEILQEQGKSILEKEFSNITFSQEQLLHTAGFILREGKVDYNYCYEQLVYHLRDEIGAEMTQKVFDLIQE